MLTTQDEDAVALQRVAAHQAVEVRMRLGWMQHGLTPSRIDTIMAPVRAVHAADEDAVQAYEQRLSG